MFSRRGIPPENPGQKGRCCQNEGFTPQVPFVLIKFTISSKLFIASDQEKLFPLYADVEIIESVAFLSKKWILSETDRL